ncbi:hypothetical protein [Candidatus Neomicrothrix sp.]|jgi:hypothetical protein|uniref:hypothetical protein n=1 Tax=Candidatus Neomicrothrix sp. TaxID=2719034 RepID=UPI001B6893BE|nr:hypothetical protein [Candidatus Microthrix sp.]MBK6437871.1 hypothetical protein [Candidatus Microthrix sp.]MBK7167161.1 hypothetical protein [Candidatus Microthrix sp.]MBP9067102.1 hypothetical protein [Candidatus Microthrix sp.]HMS48850.1 hypothetical protein [Candidatus Microthrix sp.]
MGFDFTGTPMVTIPTDDIEDIRLLNRVIIDWLHQANPEVWADFTLFAGDQPDRFLDTLGHAIARLNYWENNQ